MATCGCFMQQVSKRRSALIRKQARKQFENIFPYRDKLMRSSIISSSAYIHTCIRTYIFTRTYAILRIRNTDHPFSLPHRQADDLESIAFSYHGCSGTDERVCSILSLIHTDCDWFAFEQSILLALNYFTHFRLSISCGRDSFFSSLHICLLFICAHRILCTSIQ